MAIRLQQDNFNIIHRKGKDNVVPDLLSRAAPKICTIRTENVTPPTEIKNKWYLKLFNDVSNTPGKYPNFKIFENKLDTVVLSTPTPY